MGGDTFTRAPLKGLFTFGPASFFVFSALQAGHTVPTNFTDMLRNSSLQGHKCPDQGFAVLLAAYNQHSFRKFPPPSRKAAWSTLVIVPARARHFQSLCFSSRPHAQEMPLRRQHQLRRRSIPIAIVPVESLARRRGGWPAKFHRRVLVTPRLTWYPTQQSRSLADLPPAPRQ